MKKPTAVSNLISDCKVPVIQCAPLVLDKIVELATLVKSRLRFTLQLAMNQKMQNTEASFAVSFVVKGSSSLWADRSSVMMDGARKLVMMVDVGASSASVTGMDSYP